MCSSELIKSRRNFILIFYHYFILFAILVMLFLFGVNLTLQSIVEKYNTRPQTEHES